MVIDSTMNIYSVDHPYHISSLWNFHNSTQIQLVFSRIKPKSWFLYNFFWRTRRRSYVSGDLTIFSHCPLLMLILADLSHITLQTEKTAAHLYNSALVQRYTANVHPFIFIYSYYTYKMCLTVWERVCVQTHIWSRCTLLVSPMWMNLVALHAHGVFIVHDIVQFIGDVVVGCWIQQLEMSAVVYVRSVFAECLTNEYALAAFHRSLYELYQSPVFHWWIHSNWQKPISKNTNTNIHSSKQIAITLYTYKLLRMCKMMMIMMMMAISVRKAFFRLCNENT